MAKALTIVKSAVSVLGPDCLSGFGSLTMLFQKARVESEVAFHLFQVP
jgi:hypothetical protein